MKIFKAIEMYGAVAFFALIGFSLSEEIRVIGATSGYLFGGMVTNYLDMATKSHQAYLISRLDSGYVSPPE